MAIPHRGEGVDYTGTRLGCCRENFYIRAWNVLLLWCPKLAQGSERIPPRLQQARRTATAPFHPASSTCMTTATSTAAVRNNFLDTALFSPRLRDNRGVKIILPAQWPVTISVCWLAAWESWYVMLPSRLFVTWHHWHCCWRKWRCVLEFFLTLDCHHYYFWLFKLVLLIGLNLLVLRTHSSASGWTHFTLRLREGFYF